MFIAGLAPGLLGVMLLFISARLPERGAGLREVLGFIFVYTDQSGRWSAAVGRQLAVQRLMRVNVAATEFVDDVSPCALPWGELG